MKVLVTGSQGFIGSYVCTELLEKGYEVVGVDNYSKYGYVKRAHDKHPNFFFIEMDAKDLPSCVEKFYDIDYIVAGAAMIGGISYFHKYAYDLLAENERITASTFDLAIKLWGTHALKRIVVLSSSMVFEKANAFPSSEGLVPITPPPLSTYGFQKLAVEYFAKGAYEQYKLPYTVVRPFNCVGVGEDEALGEEEITSGNIKLMMSHVLPDLVNKVLSGQDPLHILGSGEQIRCYTNGKDIAKGIRLCMEYTDEPTDFNISVTQAHTVYQLATLVYREITGDKEASPRVIHDEPYEYDVQKRIPSTWKAKNVLGFEAEVSLEDSVKEVVKYMREKNETFNSPPSDKN